MYQATANTNVLLSSNVISTGYITSSRLNLYPLSRYLISISVITFLQYNKKLSSENVNGIFFILRTML